MPSRSPFIVRIALLIGLLLLAAQESSATPPSETGDAGARQRTDRTSSTPVTKLGQTLGLLPESIPDETRYLEQLGRQSRLVGQLTADQLEEQVDFKRLLGVDPDNAVETEVERRKWQLLVESVAGKHPDAGVPAATSIAGDSLDAGAPATAEPDFGTRVWQAEVSLARSRLAFFALAPARRQSLLDNARARAEEKAASETDTERQLIEAKAAAEKATEARKEALAAAQAASSEAQKLLHEQQARLLTIKAQQAALNAELLEREQAATEATESAIGWRRRVTELISQGLSAPADGLYDELRGQLRDARQKLALQLQAVREQRVTIPTPGPDEVMTRGVTIDRTAYDQLRTELHTQSLVLTEKHRAVLWLEAESFLSQAESLNRDRLRLLQFVSPELRGRLTGFSGQGLDQARAEAEQVRLVVRYHVLAAVDWLDSFSRRRQARLEQLWERVGWIKLLLAIALFWTWRRRGGQVLDGLAAEARKKRIRSWSDEATITLTRIYRRIRTPLEWLLLAWVTRELLDRVVYERLEVRVLWLVISWTLGGAALVLLIDALAARRRSFGTQKTQVAALRLKSLRLVGRTVVVFGLILTLSAEFVGEGTVHSWVISSCWLAIVPIMLLLISWWKPTIFERLRPRENKNALPKWALSHERSPLRHVAAGVGSLYLIALSVIRWVREYLIELELVKQLLAYLFQRSMSEQAETTRALHPLPESLSDQLTHPAPPEASLVELPEHGEYRRAIQQSTDANGGLFALVGELGSGKSTFVRTLSSKLDATLFIVQCPTGGTSTFQSALCQTLGITNCRTSEQLRAALGQFADGPNRGAIVIIDDAHRLMTPTIGGLRALKDVLSMARQAGSLTWLFTFDSALFNLFEQAHGVRPVFDEVFRLKQWSEQQVANLVDSRNQLAQIEPSMRLLLPDVRRSDELDHSERLARTREGFYRMLWNFSDGNPAVALHFWAQSLGSDESDDIYVRPLTTPKTADLESLPDTSAFVLRALVRLEVATAQQIAEASNVDLDRVRSVLRYAVNRGYIESHRHAELTISRHWFRSITRVLQRKHFLPST